MLDKKIYGIMEIMNTIKYGYKDKFGNNIIDINPNKWENEFNNFYRLLTPDELLKTKCGICWDQVELERKLFDDNNIGCKTFFIYIKDKDMLPSHTFLTYENNNKYFWFEHSWSKYKGIHEYETLFDLLLDVQNKFKKDYSDVDESATLYLYEYKKPKHSISCNEFYEYIETQELIDFN